jgi:hypothetical protein
MQSSATVQDMAVYLGVRNAHFFSALKLVPPDLQHKVGALRASLERLDRAIDTEAAKKARERCDDPLEAKMSTGSLWA